MLVTATGDADARVYFTDKAHAYRSSATHADARELDRMLRLLDAHGPRLAGARAVDVATGGGHTARALTAAGARVAATDLTRTMLEPMKRAEAADRVLADALALPFRDARVDVVASRIAPHHFPDLHAFAKEAARVLRPGGAFYAFDLTTPPGRPAARDVINGIERLRDPSHVDSYPPDEWRAAFEDAGLDVRHLADTASTFDMEPWIARAAMPPERERALRALLAEPPVDLGGYGRTSDGRMRVLRVELVAVKA